MTDRSTCLPWAGSTTDWPVSEARLSPLIGLGVAAAWGLLLELRWLWRRRTRVF